MLAKAKQKLRASKSMARLMRRPDTASESSASLEIATNDQPVAANEPPGALTPKSQSSMNGSRLGPPAPPPHTKSTITLVPPEADHTPPRTVSSRAGSPSPVPSPQLVPSDRLVVPKGPSTTSTVLRRVSSRIYSPLDQVNVVPDGVDSEPDSQGGAEVTMAVGRAGLGKSGRVIDNLQTTNSNLKRELGVARTVADELQRDAANAEAKASQFQEKYESAAREASNYKSMLERSERRLEAAKLQIQEEKKKTDAAKDEELRWRSLMDDVREEARDKVDEANERREQMESRNSILERQMTTLDAKVQRLIQEAVVLRQQRSADDTQIQALRAVHVQLNQRIADTNAARDAVTQQYEDYRAENESLTQPIRERCQKLEAEYEAKIKEMNRVCEQMKWTIGVSNARGGGNVESSGGRPQGKSSPPGFCCPSLV